MLGSHFDNIELIRRQAEGSQHDIDLIDSPGGLWQLMNWADLAVSGGGGTLCELACLGVPAVAVEISANQGPMVREFNTQGSIIGFTYEDRAQTSSELMKALARLRDDPKIMRKMASIGPRLIDGRGASRTVDWIAKLARGRGIDL